MASVRTTRVAYLFGAGATHAELAQSFPAIVENGMGLLTDNVSARVIEKARREPTYLEDVEAVSGVKGSLNIELLISLIESAKIHGWESKTHMLKQLVQDDIQAILKPSVVRRFHLQQALIEFHRHPRVRSVELLIGLISLNYDTTLDRAYKRYYGSPNYCFSLARDAVNGRKIPLLKLHGSFNWGQQRIRGRIRKIEIIPLGSSKNYLHAPYGFIWNRALEILIECDVLRVIGCSLSQNDVHLVDLLFKAHLERQKPFEIQLINSLEVGEQIRRNYGFFPEMKTLTEIEGSLIPDPRPGNPFAVWLKYKVLSVLRNRGSQAGALRMAVD
jgi:hypothetical protein